MANNLAKVQYLNIISPTKHKNKILNLLAEMGARGINTAYCKGSIDKGFLLQAFGLETEENKLLTTCLIPLEKAQEVIEILKEEFSFSKANTGIAFSIPVGGF